MSDIPAEAITAAADAIHYGNAGPASGLPCLCLPSHPTDRYERDRSAAVRALSAAGPVTAATATTTERARIRDGVTELLEHFERRLAFTAPELYPMRILQLRSDIADLLEGHDNAE